VPVGGPTAGTTTMSILRSLKSVVKNTWSMIRLPHQNGSRKNLGTMICRIINRGDDDKKIKMCFVQILVNVLKRQGNAIAWVQMRPFAKKKHCQYL